MPAVQSPAAVSGAAIAKETSAGVLPSDLRTATNSGSAPVANLSPPMLSFWTFWPHMVSGRSASSALSVLGKAKLGMGTLAGASLAAASLGAATLGAASLAAVAVGAAEAPAAVERCGALAVAPVDPPHAASASGRDDQQRRPD